MPRYHVRVITPKGKPILYLAQNYHDGPRRAVHGNLQPPPHLAKTARAFSQDRDRDNATAEQVVR